MKKCLKAVCAMLLISAASFGQKLPADSIFASFYKATGGKELWEGVKSVHLKRSYTAASAAPYTADITVSVPDKSIYKNKTIMKRSFVYAVKGNQGWIKVPIGGKMDVKDLSAAEQQKMRFEVYEAVVPFADYKNRGLIATTVGPETLNGTQVNNVELQGQGIRYNLYFDAKTGLLVRQKNLLAGVETVADYSNYTKSPYGVMYPAKIVETNSIDKKPVTIQSTMTVNEQVSAALFQR